jgi:glycine hydroxymethyltransferase
MTLADRSWLPEVASARIQEVVAAAAELEPTALADHVLELRGRNRAIHEVECVNLNPASNVMNPRAEALLAAGLGTRASLGYPGEKYEMGLEAIEEIEVIAAELAGEVFNAPYVEVRVPSGAMANLYGFMATCEPGDTVIVPPASIGGHATHHEVGAAGFYRLRVIPAPVSREGYSVDVDALADLAARERPRLITIGGSLNLHPHPVGEIREIADGIGSKVLFDAAHLSGLIAGGAWPNPLDQGAHLMTMSTYKSLGGPPGGLLVANDAALAERIEAIAYPGLTANFDVGKTAALAMTLLDWQVAGPAYARRMVELAAELADRLLAQEVPVFRAGQRPTESHQFAIEAADYGGGQAAARRLRQANLLTSGIGLPMAELDGDFNGLRLGTPELARIGMTASNMPMLTYFITRALNADPVQLAPAVSAWRRGFDRVHFTLENPS